MDKFADMNWSFSELLPPGEGYAKIGRQRAADQASVSLTEPGMAQWEIRGWQLHERTLAPARRTFEEEEGRSIGYDTCRLHSTGRSYAG